MEKQEYIHFICNVFAENGYGNIIDSDKAGKLYDLSGMLVDANKTTNLTAITDQKAIILKHFLDCATVCEFLPEGASVIDVGCGAGFPSLPIAIIRDDIKVTSIDSTGKKIAFVENMANKLCLANIKAHCCRAEAFVKERRESFDVCTSRAVARLNALSELCLPFVKIGGTFVAMKSEKGSEELSEAKLGIEKLGGKLASKKEIALSLGDDYINRELIVFEKVSATPSAYPRNYSQIIKKPL